MDSQNSAHAKRPARWLVIVLSVALCIALAAVLVLSITLTRVVRQERERRAALAVALAAMIATESRHEATLHEAMMLRLLEMPDAAWPLYWDGVFGLPDRELAHPDRMVDQLYLSAAEGFRRSEARYGPALCVTLVEEQGVLSHERADIAPLVNGDVLLTINGEPATLNQARSVVGMGADAGEVRLLILHVMDGEYVEHEIWLSFSIFKHLVTGGRGRFPCALWPV